MGANCSRTAPTPELPDELLDDTSVLELNDSAIDHMPVGYSVRRRQAVSAEGFDCLHESLQLNKVEKSEDAEAEIRAAMQHCFLFTDLEDEQRSDIVHAMSKRIVEPGDVLIRQGEQGDNFYVIQTGTFKATKMEEGFEKLLFTYHDQGAFGELALMYNCPRAATVTAETGGVVWVMDRPTFRAIIVVSTMQKRRRYEESLQSMPLFAGLTPEQRAAIADCLSFETFQDSEHILNEGEPLRSTSKFYLVQSGTVECYKQFQGAKQHVKTIEAGGFFGEVALVEQVESRAADCIARGKVKLLSMGRDAFERLMGPAETALAGQVSEYQKYNASAAHSHSAAAEIV